MLEWLSGVFLGFFGELLRSLYSYYQARSLLRESGRLAQENKQLKEHIHFKNKAAEIRDKVNDEDNLGDIIDGL
ncbi:MAG: hypothetical protein OIF58_02655 [Cohaesibacter sp.]|nr:hypothetical protein [Cohaesibacter sp.]